MAVRKTKEKKKGEKEGEEGEEEDEEEEAETDSINTTDQARRYKENIFIEQYKSNFNKLHSRTNIHSQIHFAA
ncbi:Hypothetical predicted protein [Octopus vulgaris]|uniref:Uncharacterized protein n=1 Tax=Octopus vulgaris TaxID=6645 RepID=A0AA36FPQ5_OCTVU|nr:Hypothetical predicted protein [Octopus vulgaris]